MCPGVDWEGHTHNIHRYLDKLENTVAQSALSWPTQQALQAAQQAEAKTATSARAASLAIAYKK